MSRFTNAAAGLGGRRAIEPAQALGDPVDGVLEGRDARAARRSRRPSPRRSSTSSRRSISMTRSRRRLASSSPRTASPRTLMFSRAPCADPALDVPPQRLVLGRQDDPLRGLAHLPVDQLHGGCRRHACHPSQGSQSHVVAQPQGPRVGPLGGRGEGGCGTGRLGDAHHLVGQGHGHGQPGRVAQEPREPPAIGLLPASPDTLRDLEPGRGPGHRRVGHGVGVVGRSQAVQWHLLGQRLSLRRGGVHASHGGPVPPASPRGR